MYAASGRFGRFIDEWLKLFIDLRANVELEDNLKNTALNLVAQQADERCINTLLQKRANINHQDQNGCTALMIKMMRSEGFSVKTLLKYKADINLKDNKGRTAINYFIGEDYPVDATPIQILSDIQCIERSQSNRLTYLSIIPRDIIGIIRDILIFTRRPRADKNIQYERVSRRAPKI